MSVTIEETVLDTEQQQTVSCRSQSRSYTSIETVQQRRRARCTSQTRAMAQVKDGFDIFHWTLVGGGV
ncbi:hypothetical protein KIPB_008498 [Kipferlia bialata]|uniref:Uncharacterized protein n=1 Tax=Kipferlia bialata TaxID=797122 RepID=A0A9K3D1M6_9EUKA|nr:hypothetical protein KIPB_008498 [Kipferlia bialata]|eukprot:g8498.t1